MNLGVDQPRACVAHKYQRSIGGATSEKEGFVEYLTKPHLTFHGTRRALVPSIVQHGFLAPGSLHPVTKQSHSVFNGSVYGRGIYSSPQAWYAMMYGDNDERTTLSELPGCKLLVCATIMGRTAVMAHEDRWHDRTEPFPGADSHVNESQHAYIVFNAAQILPCYVLHLDYAGREQTQDLWDLLVRS